MRPQRLLRLGSLLACTACSSDGATGPRGYAWVQGTVSGPDGPLPGVDVSFFSDAEADCDTLGSHTATVSTSFAGTFLVGGVTPDLPRDCYSISARPAFGSDLLPSPRIKLVLPVTSRPPGDTVVVSIVLQPAAPSQLMRGR